jgi:hypothetical protein
MKKKTYGRTNIHNSYEKCLALLVTKNNTYKIGN